MASDPKAIRRFQAGVDRALGLFDATNEWADYIAFLSRLLKALQAAPSGADIPSKPLLARRLAHCLNPSLPAGVHQKALEVYDCIFTILGQDGLSRDLSLYLPGFAHTLTFASLATRPWFLALFNDHIVALPPATLRPALKALILSLLPAIEEENSEDFDKTLTTVNKLRGAFANDNSESIFWQSLFLASITSPSRRAGVLVYLTRYLPKLGQSKDASDSTHQPNKGSTPGPNVVVTPEPGLLFRCFATGLQDEQPLIQRGFLDLLVTHLPLKADTLQKSESRNDLKILVAAAMSIVLRRDMSLNRRLWAWFFGTDDKSDTEISQAAKIPSEPARKPDAANASYFQTYSLEPIVRTLSGMVQKRSAVPAQRARPFRLLISLMDRSAIGSPVVDALFSELLTDLRQYQIAAPTQDAFDEVFRSANVFFDSIEPRMLARNLLKLVQQSEFDLLKFIVLNFSLDESDLGRTHLPMVVAALSDLLVNDHAESRVDRAPRVTAVMDSLLDLIPAREHSPKSRLSSADIDATEFVRLIFKYYTSASFDAAPPKSLTTEHSLATSSANITHSIEEYLRSRYGESAFNDLVSSYCKIMSLSSASPVQPESDLIKEIIRWVNQAQTVDSSSFSVIRNLVSILAAVVPPESSDLAQTGDVSQLVPALVKHLWQYLRPSTPQYHVESVDMIWNLRSVRPDLLLVESTMMGLITGPYKEVEDHPAAQFGVFWTHTRTAQITPTSLANGHSSKQEDATQLLRQLVLYIVDASAKDERWTSWMTGLSSLTFQIQVVLDAIRHGDDEHETRLVGLHRLRMLVQIARSSSAQWKEFSDSTRAVETVSDFASAMVKQHSETPDLAVLALEVLRTIYGDASMASYSGLIEMLTEQLPQTQAGTSLQSSVLDTLHSLMSGKPDGSPPRELLGILMSGISSSSIDANLDKWITLLCNSIPMYPDSVFFANLLKLTACFCQRTQSFFDGLRSMYEGVVQAKNSASTQSNASPERSITNLLSGLEYILARAHTKVIDVTRPPSASQDSSASSEVARSRTVANNRLTVVLCMQDAIKICGVMWFWRPSKKSAAVPDTKSFNYMSSRLRARTRRMLEHLLEAEPQECLETIMGLWIQKANTSSQEYLVMNLLQTLDGARPKFMLPAIFNAIYSRTNPGVLDQSQRSSLSTDATAIELVAFLIEYVSKLEDDLLEEIWSDCVSFLRDILANPMPHRQLLLRLLELLAALCDKMENTTFGEQGRMRRELADLSTRLFTAIFTIKPGGLDQGSTVKAETQDNTAAASRLDSGKGIDILLEVLPAMTPILSEGDRISTICTGISTYIIAPSLKARSYPDSLNNNILGLVQVMGKSSSTNKTWKKDIIDAFNDSRLFGSSLAVAETGWIPTVRHLAVIDKGLFADITSRLTAPTTAGIMFGVGATAARTEADKLTRTNLRRVALLLLASDKDQFVGHLIPLMAKVDELLTATPATSPSSATRGDIFLLLRAISLSFAQENLVSVWPVLDAELRELFNDLQKKSEASMTPYSHLQGAKLLDLLLLLKPEEFQLHEWLFVTDTIDAIYPPPDCKTIAAADIVNLEGTEHVDLQSATVDGTRKPWLASEVSRDAREVRGLLGSFFSQLSIRVFEDTYSLEPVDMVMCRKDLVADLFSDGE
ncbi:uncharacterized protein HMPREF1541_06062 [Cyphellophora europaea CBS 101466]|uniref:Uncharacterized protein n=1 Tax=Cyphellophora europaea (strain CBS 101466) TaxID=1220924 RepID=W2RTK4_CYPE1|nr:uncharacterized protein HMPREF1541_06062 [Cyphellophora europaea CBS 101466]ETN39836.1 hypothetical protein HMPREF1541_06062 [Cyphellophora europaea CBS 101466]